MHIRIKQNVERKVIVINFLKYKFLKKLPAKNQNSKLKQIFLNITYLDLASYGAQSYEEKILKLDVLKKILTKNKNSKNEL